MPTELEQRARELLAAEYERQGSRGFAEALRSGGDAGTDVFYLRAITAALQAQQPGEPMFTASMYGSAEAASKARAEWEAQQPGAQAADLYTVDDSAQACSDGCCGGCQFRPYIPQPPSIPEPSEDDVEAAKDAFDDVYDGMPGSDRPSLRAALATYTAWLRERIGQAPGGDGDA